MDHKDLKLGQIGYVLVFYFPGFFRRIVSNLYFCCVTVKMIYYGIEFFFKRYFGNLDFKVRYCGII